jgi:hypothetical protein
LECEIRLHTKSTRRHLDGDAIGSLSAVRDSKRPGSRADFIRRKRIERLRQIDSTAPGEEDPVSAPPVRVSLLARRTIGTEATAAVATVVASWTVRYAGRNGAAPARIDASVGLLLILLDTAVTTTRPAGVRAHWMPEARADAETANGTGLAFDACLASGFAVVAESRAETAAPVARIVSA